METQKLDLNRVRMTLRPALEVLMYLAFCGAPIPAVWLGVNELVYYHAHPEMIESRDSALLVFAAMYAMRFMEIALALGALLALFFLVAGPPAARYSGTALIIAWILTFVACILFIPSTPFESMARLLGHHAVSGPVTAAVGHCEHPVGAAEKDAPLGERAHRPVVIQGRQVGAAELGSHGRSQQR